MSRSVVQLHRYPVKSMGGERLDEVVVDRRGLAGDRWWGVATDDGRLATGKSTRRWRRLDAVFDATARGVNGRAEVSVAGGPWLRADDPHSGTALSEHCGEPVRLVQEGVGDHAAVQDHMDGGRVSLVGTASLDALADLADGTERPVDVRHFRTNLLVSTETPWEEETWLGREVRVGGVVLRVVEKAERCRTIDLAQDGTGAHPGLLRTLGQHRQLFTAVYCDVVSPGTVRVGDAVEVL